MDLRADRRRIGVVSLVLLLGTFFLYFPVLRHDFVNYDDPKYVTENVQVKNGLTLAGELWAFKTGHAHNWHPLTWLSHELDCRLYGLKPAGHHLTNLLFHLANTLLLFGVLFSMTGALRRSALVAALFAWHPLHVESVAWVAERKDVLSAFFWLLAMAAYARYVSESKARSPAARVFYGLTLLSLVLGLMSKPMVVTLPFVLLLLDYWPLGRSAACGVTARPAKRSGDGSAELGKTDEPVVRPVRLTSLLWEKAPMLALVFASCVVTFFVQNRGGTLASLEAIPLPDRFTNALVSYFEYIRKMFWPNDLAVFYPLEPARAVWQWAGAGLFLLAISLAVIIPGRRRPYLVVGWFWFLGTLLPVIGLVQVGAQAMADRYSYLPSIGLLIMVVWGIGELTQSWPRRNFILGSASAAVLAACAYCTATQLGYWRNSLTLFGHALEVTKNNATAHEALGQALDAQGQFGEAMGHYLAALKIDPRSPVTYYLMGLSSARQGNLPGAIEDYQESLRRREDPDAHYNLANALTAQGKLAEAAFHYSAALRLEPDSADAQNNLGAVLARLGRTEEAIDHFKAALRINPAFPEARDQLGSLMLKLGRLEAARAHFEEAVRLKPDFVHARLKLGLVQARLGDADAAIASFLAALKLEPNNADAYYNLAGVYAGKNDLVRAADGYAQAARCRPEDADTRGRLAAVLAAQGKFAQALPVYREALRLKPDWPEALRDLAWILATSPQAELRDGSEAVQLAQRACALVGKPDPRYLSALDVAYAETGKFAEAIKTAGQIQELTRGTSQQNIAGQAAHRLELYRAGKPFRD